MAEILQENAEAVPGPHFAHFFFDAGGAAEHTAGGVARFFRAAAISFFFVGYKLEMSLQLALDIFFAIPPAAPHVIPFPPQAT